MLCKELSNSNALLHTVLKYTLIIESGRERDRGTTWVIWAVLYFNAIWFIVIAS